MSEQEANDFQPAVRRTAETSVYRAALMIGTGILLFFVLVWLIDLEQRLPDVRAPQEFSNSDVLAGHAIMPPGFHDIDEVDLERSGEWITQEIGDDTWLATDTPGSRAQAAFYGTDVYLVARIGPEAGRAYVRVDGEPVSGLNEDEQGTYSDLWAGEASDQPILVASGLAHGEHLVEVTAGGDGEVAISAFDVVAETPFRWAFLLAYTGIGGGLFIVIRQLLTTISQRESSFTAHGRSRHADTDARA